MSQHIPSSRRAGGALALAAALACSAGPFGALLRPAHAIDIVVVYDPTPADAVNCCAGSFECCNNGPDPVAALTDLMQAAANHWSSIILDAHQVTIRFWYSSESSPAANVDSVVDGKPATAWIRIPASQTFFLDPAPNDHSAFNMGSRFYRTLHPAEQSEALSGSVPELLEVGYNGPALAAMNNDLLTIILHEMGHALGLVSSVINQQTVPPCDPNGQPWFVPFPGFTGNSPIGIKSFELANGTFDCAHLALGGIIACNDDFLCESHQSLMWPGLLPSARALPSAVDILALAAAAGWGEINIPRKFPVGSGEWIDELTWIGGRVPDGDDEVGILNELAPTTIELVGTGNAGNVTVSANNTLDIFIGQLDLSGGLFLTGADARALLQVGTELDAAEIDIAAGASLTVQTLAHVHTESLWNGGTIDGGGIVETASLNNIGMIRALGGTLEVTASDFLDLDGPTDSGTAVIEAIVSDLIIAGPLNDQVRASIFVGSDRMLSLPNGFEQD